MTLRAARPDRANAHGPSVGPKHVTAHAYATLQMYRAPKAPMTIVCDRERIGFIGCRHGMWAGGGAETKANETPRAKARGPTERSGVGEPERRGHLSLMARDSEAPTNALYGSNRTSQPPMHTSDILTLAPGSRRMQLHSELSKSGPLRAKKRFHQNSPSKIDCN
jgi:hypothetical protein